MELTDVRVREVSGQGNLKAYVTVTFDNCFVLHNVKIIEGKQGLFVAMPSRRMENGEFKDIAHPINLDFRSKMQDKILAEYSSGRAKEDSSSGE